MTTVVAEGLSKRYRIGEYRAGYETLRDTLVARRPPRAPARARRPLARGALGAQGRVLHDRGGRGRRLHRHERRRQVDAPQGPHPDHAADRGHRLDPRARGEHPRGRHRLPPRADGPREHVPERRDPRHEAARDQREVRRHRRVQRDREVHRYAGQALLERHVRAARIRRRGAPRPGGADHRRGARRRRLRVPAALHGPDRGHLGLGADGALRLARHAGDRRGSAVAPTGCRTGASRPRGRARRSSAQYLQDASGVGPERRLRARRGAGDRRPSASSRRGSSTRAERRRTGPTCASRSGSSSASRSCGRPARSSRRSSSATTAGEVVFNALDTDARWRDARRTSARTRAPPGSRRTS